MPKQKVMTVYTAAELKALEEDADHDGRPFTRALEKYREHLDLTWTSDEMMSSLKALCDAAGVKIRDYSLGAYNWGNNLSVSIPGSDWRSAGEGTADLTGARALAWIENRILGPLRAPWGLPKLSWRRDGIHNASPSNDGYHVVDGIVRRYTAPGHVPECPFTGVTFDHLFLDDLIKSVKDGRTLKEAFEDLADVFARSLEEEYEYQSKEEQFLEAAEANDWGYDADGDMV